MLPHVRRKLRFLPLPSACERGAAILWLAVAALVLLSLPLFVLFANLRSEVANLQAAIVAAQVALAQPLSSEELAALQAAAASNDAVEAGLQGSIADAAQGAPWQALLECIVPPPSLPVRLTGLHQLGADLTVQGLAGEAALSAYVARLSGTPLFDLVACQPATGATPTADGAIPFSVALRLRGYHP